MNYSSVPLVCMESLIALEDSLEGQTALTRGFVGRYVEMWPSRYLRLSIAFSAGQWEEATDSALSLFSSSAMVGADRLGQMSGDLVELLKQGRQEQAQDALEEVESCGNETVAELMARYVQPAS
ncbi:Hpt domain-containing protein [Arthrobacter sp. AQ5-05]|nr:Hpt domain-containing protein [Arthrobacter sp. AQ5-05]